MALYPTVLDLIGNTPMIDISALSPNPAARIFMKLEGQNPGGSVKDRVALSLVEEAERAGVLVPGKPDQILMEPTSGNTGIGLAMVCKVKGYTLKVVMPTNVSVERRQLLELWGAEIIESPGSEGSNGAVRMARAWPRSTPSGSSSTSTATRPTPRRTTRAPGPRSSGTARASRTSWPGSGRRGRCSASGASCARSSARPCRSGPSSPRRGRWSTGCATSTTATSRPSSRTSGAPSSGPQDRGAAAGVDRVDAAPDRGGDLRRHLVGGGPGRRGQVRGVAARG